MKACRVLAAAGLDPGRRSPRGAGGKGRKREASHPLPHRSGRRDLDLLSGGGPEGSADDSPAARRSHLVAAVRAPVRAPLRPLSPGRARLPGLRAQRLAGPEEVRVHLRPHRRDHESFHRGARALALHALHARLRRPGRFPDGPRAPGPRRGAHRPGRRGPRRGPRPELEGAPRLLGRPRREREPRCAPTCCRSRPRARGTSGAIPTSSATTRTSGPTSSAFSTRPARGTSRATSSTTTGRTSTRTRSGRPGCARSSPGCSSSGASTTSRSSCRSRSRTRRTCRCAVVGARRRPLRARHASRRDRGADPGLPRSGALRSSSVSSRPPGPRRETAARSRGTASSDRFRRGIRRGGRPDSRTSRRSVRTV